MSQQVESPLVAELENWQDSLSIHINSKRGARLDGVECDALWSALDRAASRIRDLESQLAAPQTGTAQPVDADVRERVARELWETRIKEYEASEFGLKAWSALTADQRADTYALADRILSIPGVRALQGVHTMACWQCGAPACTVEHCAIKGHEQSCETVDGKWACSEQCYDFITRNVGGGGGQPVTAQPVEVGVRERVADILRQLVLASFSDYDALDFHVEADRILSITAPRKDTAQSVETLPCAMCGKRTLGTIGICGPCLTRVEIGEAQIEAGQYVTSDELIATLRVSRAPSSASVPSPTPVAEEPTQKLRQVRFHTPGSPVRKPDMLRDTPINSVLRDKHVSDANTQGGAANYEAQAAAIRAQSERIRELTEAMRRLLAGLGECGGHDHHGNCQMHFVENPCSVAAARSLLTDSPTPGGQG